MSDIICKKGQVIIFEAGEYSERFDIAHMVALEDLTLNDYNEAIKSFESKILGYGFEYDELIANLIKTGKLLEINCVTFNLHEYAEREENSCFKFLRPLKVKNELDKRRG